MIPLQAVSVPERIYEQSILEKKSVEGIHLMKNYPAFKEINTEWGYSLEAFPILTLVHHYYKFRIFFNV